MERKILSVQDLADSRTPNLVLSPRLYAAAEAEFKSLQNRLAPSTLRNSASPMNGMGS